MNTTKSSPPVLTVLVGVDYSDLGDQALNEAISAAQARARNRLHLHVVHVVQGFQTSGPVSTVPHVVAVDDAVAAQNAEELRKYVEKTLAQPGEGATDDEPIIERLTLHVRFMDPAEAIAQLASDIEADLVVVGTHGRRGLGRLLLGSVAEGVVRLAPCPVLVVRPRHKPIENLPAIEPACPQCLEARRATDGKQFWCAQHSERHERRHTYSFGPVRSGHQSGLLLPIPR